MISIHIGQLSEFSGGDKNGQLIGIYGLVDIHAATNSPTLFGIPVNTASRFAKRSGINLDPPDTDEPQPPRITSPTEPRRNSEVTTSKPLFIILPPDPPLTIPSTEPSLISAATKIDYTSLRNLLAARKWREADDRTTDLMFKAAGREAYRKLGFTEQSLREFPCSDLKIIDSLWVEYSQGRFGFSIQNSILLDAGNKPGAHEDRAFSSFGDRIGWRVGGEWLSYKEIIYTDTAPRGHLPRFNGILRIYFKGEIFSARVAECKL